MALRQLPIGVRTYVENTPHSSFDTWTAPSTGDFRGSSSKSLANGDHGELYNNSNDHATKTAKASPAAMPFGWRVMVFDTETTIDKNQSLTFGSAKIYAVPHRNTTKADNDVYMIDPFRLKLERELLFTGSAISNEQLNLIRDYAQSQRVEWMSVETFADMVLIPEIRDCGTVLVGFNLSFDLSRVAVSTKTFQYGKHKDEFEIILSTNKYQPSILVHPIDSKKAFYRLNYATLPGAKEQFAKHNGRFVDARTLVWALTNNSHSLYSASHHLYQTRVTHKKSIAESHGGISVDYIDYNRNDVTATWEVYREAVKDFYRHPIIDKEGNPKTPDKIYSPAGMGKAYMETMGIRPFMEVNPEFPKWLLAYAMQSYYGGRSEIHYRKQPIQTFYTDVVSMYPSVFTLMGLWSFVVADTLQWRDVTEETQRFMKTITLDSLFDPEKFKLLNVICLVKPNNNILPIRAEYAASYNIGLNYLDTQGKVIPYTLADIIASKILGGSYPEIVAAYSVFPQGVQPNLKPVQIMGRDDATINPTTDNFFKRIIELRQDIKQKANHPTTDEDRALHDEHDALQLFLKILANSTSYGIYVELNRSEEDTAKSVEIYNLPDDTLYGESYNEPNRATAKQMVDVESQGRYFNPILASFITGGARLILSMIEQRTLNAGGSYAFTDTDSMAMTPDNRQGDHLDQCESLIDIGQSVVKQFESLYPYASSVPKSLLGIEDMNYARKNWDIDSDYENLTTKLYPLYCYAIAAKRYVLFNLVPASTTETDSLPSDFAKGTPTNAVAQSNIIIRKFSVHGLGHLKNPWPRSRTDAWQKAFWLSILEKELHHQDMTLDFLELPALGSLQVGKPNLYQVVQRDKTLPYTNRVKPFGFMTVAYPNTTKKEIPQYLVNTYFCSKYHAVGVGTCRQKSSCPMSRTCLANVSRAPITSFLNDPREWNTASWLDKATLTPLTVSLPDTETIQASTANQNQSTNLLLKTYRDVWLEYPNHPETKYDDLDGLPCNRTTTGWLQRTHVRAMKIRLIGKESNTIFDLEEDAVLASVEHHDHNTLEYNEISIVPTKEGDSRETPEWTFARQLLKAHLVNKRQWANTLDLSYNHFKNILAGRNIPTKAFLDAMIQKLNNPPPKKDRDPKDPSVEPKKKLEVAHALREARISFQKNDNSLGPMAFASLDYFIEGTQFSQGDLAQMRNSVRPISWIHAKGFNVSQIEMADPQALIMVNGVQYVYLSEKVQSLLAKRKTKLPQIIHSQIKSMEFNGVQALAWDDRLKTWNPISLKLSDIEKVWASKAKGHAKPILMARTLNRILVKIVLTDNSLYRKYHLLPKPTDLWAMGTREPIQTKNRSRQDSEEFYLWLVQRISLNTASRIYYIKQASIIDAINQGKIMIEDAGKTAINQPPSVSQEYQAMTSYPWIHSVSIMQWFMESHGG